ncbi:SMODS-associated NUDIX domain-containing protein [Terrisporobacter sp.]
MEKKIIKLILDWLIKNKNYIKLYLSGFTKYRGEDIRVSISYLYQIKIDSKYLLVKSKRIENQYQPVGGVYKVYKSARTVLNDLGVQDESGYKFDESLRDDLRVIVPQKNLVKFVKWFESKKDRETGQSREFIEELVNTNILSKDTFPYIDPVYKKRNNYKIKFSHHFQKPELLIREIYQLNLTSQQEDELRNLLNKDDSDYYRWFEYEEIKKLGNSKERPCRIGEHTLDIL